MLLLLLLVAAIQRHLRSLINRHTVLVGHALDNDLAALKVYRSHGGVFNILAGRLLASSVIWQHFDVDRAALDAAWNLELQDPVHLPPVIMHNRSHSSSLVDKRLWQSIIGQASWSC